MLVVLWGLQGTCVYVVCDVFVDIGLAKPEIFGYLRPDGRSNVHIHAFVPPPPLPGPHPYLD